MGLHFLLVLTSLAADGPSHFATLDNARVHYESYGTGKEAIVFIHGWSCDLTFWRGQAPIYRKHRALLIDLPGHGRRDKAVIASPAEPISPPRNTAIPNLRTITALVTRHSR